MNLKELCINKTCHFSFVFFWLTNACYCINEFTKILMYIVNHFSSFININKNLNFGKREHIKN